MAVELSLLHIHDMPDPLRAAGLDRTRDAQVAPTAALLADPARIAILWALADGRALPAGELARTAGVRPATISAHLGRLKAAGWIASEAVGRHRYIRLVNPDVAGVLEALALISAPPDPERRAGSIDGGLRLARSCYDHLAGAAGVAITETLSREGTLDLEGRTYSITSEGRARFGKLGIDVDLEARESRRTGRYFTRACLDWSERRYHLAGALGHALLNRVLELEWFERRRGTRALRLTNGGRRALAREFGVRLL